MLNACLHIADSRDHVFKHTVCETGKNNGFNKADTIG